ncbi:Hcp family type VI secretion system effector [Zooshikella marina]|uniref:Hcp family type VI secretion system effector n=1 Tax=Zooshikella ganghwensis TaxID=202772 RepID=UPI001BB00D9B|nr:Hcp family type VI secretion system effector [Zooshikella ganghwensis]MBU2708801.1 Hcp family type VI secretion system effector [Zooshikella ganghwensis]
MANPAYLTVEGEKQGLITVGNFTESSVGNIYQEGFEDTIMVQSASHNMTLPTDPQSGQPSGQRVHNPFVISKALDKSSPLLANALSTGERLTKWELHLYRTSAQGTQEHYYTIKLLDAIIVDITFGLPDCQTAGGLPAQEVVSFSYRKIEWDHSVCGTAGFDDWRCLR